MVNEGIFGLEETITPEIQGDKVVVQRRLTRHNGAAAIPPGQSVEFQFYVAQFPFDVLITESGPQITTSERSATPRIGVSDTSPRGLGLVSGAERLIEGRVADATGSSPAGDGGNVLAGAGGNVLAGEGARGARLLSGDNARSFEITREMLGTAVAAEVEAAAVDGEPGGGPSTTGVIARMRGVDTSIFGDLLIRDPFPPPDLPDRMIPFEVTLTPPNGLEPIVMINPMASRLKNYPSDTQARIDPVFLDKGRGLWKISVKNTNANARRITVTVISKHAFASLRQQDLPLSLLNHLMGSVFKKSLPTIAFSNGNVVVHTPTHFLGLMGLDSEFAVGGVIASLIDSMPTFSPIVAAIESRSALIDRIIKRREAIYAEFAAQIIANPNSYSALSARMNKAVEACNASIKTLTDLPPGSAEFCIVVEGMFSDAPISLDYVGTVANISNKLPQIALVFGQGMTLSQVVTNIGVDVSPALTKVVLGTAALTALSAVALTSIFAPLGVGLALYGGYKVYNSIKDYDVEERIRAAIRDRGPVISHYVKSSFERISALGASALRCQLVPNGAPDGKDALRIFYFDPATAVPPRPRRPFEDAAAPIFDTFMIASGETGRGPAMGLTTGRPRGRGRAIERRVILARETPGELPADFNVGNPQTLAALDQHNAIIVLMMENRSHDHFFHDLADTFPGRGYTRVPSGFTNVAPPGFGAPFGVTKNADIGIGNSLIFGHFADVSSFDPNHNYEHTMFQIGGGTEETRGSGAMQGFAVDFAQECDSPQIVMSYFGMESLPVYRVLADHYPVCENWFAALPVGTYPNRLAMLQGNVPFLHNIHPDDPAIGYLEDYSIFDLLNSQGISWKFFESDLGTIRLYDRYRLDVANVRPISELENTLKVGRDTGQLPRVMFVEPEFLFGNDDHPPMNIQDGQDFIKQVIGKFIDYGLLDRVMFLITYDEHGGYFDHVPPPGTEHGPPEWRENFAGLYPQDPAKEPKSLGVRVPSLMLSKFATVNAKHQIVDHTSILKTILLHNRLQISTAQFARFGERLKQQRCAHFGELLDLQVPRQIDYAAVANAMGYRSDASWFSGQPTIVEGRVARLSPAHPARVLRGIAQPRAKRYVGA